MPAAFSASADFSAITHKVALEIQDVEHGAYMRVDEAGTVAAAATGISTVPTAVLGGPVLHLSLNHPFLLFLRDDSTGTLLFAGRVANPAQS
jgi:serpin B